MADQVKIKVALEQSAVKTGLASLRNQFTSLKSAAAGALSALGPAALVIAAVGAVVELGKSAIDTAGQLQDLAEKFDIDADALQRFSQVADKNGSSLEGVAGAMNKLALSQEKVREGNDEAAKALDDLGLSADDFINLSVEDAMYKISDAVEGAADRGKAYAAVQKLMGKSSGELFTTLEMGSKAIKAQSADAGSMSKETIATLDDFGDRIGALKDKLLNYAGNSLAFLINMADAAVQGIQRAVAAFNFFTGKTTEAEYTDTLKGIDAPKEAKTGKKGHRDLEGGADGGAAKEKKSQVFADALTKAGGGGIAYLAPEAEAQKASAASLAAIAADTKANGQTLKQIAEKSGWSH